MRKIGIKTTQVGRISFPIKSLEHLPKCDQILGQLYGKGRLQLSRATEPVYRVFVVILTSLNALKWLDPSFPISVFELFVLW